MAACDKINAGGGTDEEHKHEMILVEGVNPTAFTDGYRSSYRCTSCDKYYLDEHGRIEIGDKVAWENWKTESGEGLLPRPKYLCFTAEEAGSTLIIKFKAIDDQGNPDESLIPDENLIPVLDYTTDGTTWTRYEVNSQIVTLANIGDKVAFKGNNMTLSDGSSFTNFEMTGRIAASGDVFSILNPGSSSNYWCHRLFEDCKSLTTAPELSSESLVTGCYRFMFFGCTSLTKAPNLPARELTTMCYLGMFDGCTSLENAPELPAKDLALMCYSNMFYDCNSIKSIKADFLVADKNALDKWIPKESSGTFYRNPAATWTREEALIPESWTIVDSADQ